MKAKDFNKQALQILKQHFSPNDGCSMLPERYEIDTVLGKLSIAFSPSPRAKVYSINMRFTEPNNFSQKFFDEWLGSCFSFNRFSLKWNICLFEADEVLNEFDERLGNLKFLEGKR